MPELLVKVSPDRGRGWCVDLPAAADEALHFTDREEAVAAAREYLLDHRGELRELLVLDAYWRVTRREQVEDLT